MAEKNNSQTLPLLSKLPKLDLNITNRCNLRCKHCAFDSGIIPMSEMSLEELTTLLTETRKLGGRKIDVTGGEPTTRSDYQQIIDAAKRLGYKVELVTNSLLLNQEKLEQFRSLGLDSIAISLDGSTWQTHQHIRNTTSQQYSRVLENIAACVDLGFYTKINTTIFQSNLTDIPKIIQCGIDYGVQEVGLYYFTPVGRGNRGGEKSVEPLKWLNFIRTKLLPYKNKMNISLEVPLIETSLYNPEKGCIANTDAYHLQVLPDGKVYPCAIMASYQKPLANLHQTGVSEIWNDGNIWKDYQPVLQDLFSKHGSCVNFPNFDLRQYPGYSFVCPLRKFTLDEFSGGESNLSGGIK